MNLLRTIGRPRAPNVPSWASAEEIAACEREYAYAFERVHGGEATDAWNSRIEEHTARLEAQITTAASPEPHSCTHCQRLIIDVSGPLVFNSSGTAIHPKALDLQCSLRDAQDGAKYGCEFFQQLLSQWHPQDLAKEDEQHYHVFAYGYVDSDNAEFDVLSLGTIGLIDSRAGWSKWDNANHRDRNAPLAMLDVYTECDDLASTFITGRPISIDPWSVKTAEMTRSSLSSCLQCSEAMNEEIVSISSEQAPARLLAISKSNEGWSLRLAEVSGAMTRYCTLSYCWGLTQRGSTTSRNIEERHGHIEFSTISRTIQDAIIVSWDLGICHLWVDALCIIQDDDVDKAREISKMSHIYANACLTICTSRALFADEGFLQPRIPFATNSPIFRLAYQLPHEERRGSIVLCNHSAYSRDNKLETRAWGFQERMLSRRILDFDGTTTSFLCYHTNETQSHSYRDGGRLDHASHWRHIDWYRRLFIEFDNIAASIDDRMAVSDVNNTWSGIVRGYTERSVTNSTDRVLAIAAIAERFAMFTKDEYFGGLWKRTLPWSLMWCMRTRKVRPPRPARSQTAYQGPSWSWLGINGPVHFFHAKELLEEKAQVAVEYITHEMDLQYDTAPFGAMKSASIVLKGLVRKARWIRNDKPRSVEDYDYLAIHESDQPNWSPRRRAPTSRKKSDHYHPYTPEEIIPAKMLPDALEPEFALPIASGGSADLDVILLQMFKHNGVPIGLVLRDPGRTHKGFHERLGIFYLAKGQHFRFRDDEEDEPTGPKKSVDEGEVNRDTARTEQDKTELPEDKNEDDEELLLLRWEYAEGIDSQTSTTLLDDMKPYSTKIGKALEKAIEQQLQDEREDQSWEKWKDWFEDEDNEAQVLVLI